MNLTTKDYIVTKDDIEVVEKPSEDIARDELLSEERLVEAIVTKWNELVSATENKTIQFSLVVNKLLKDFPDEQKKAIMLKVVKHKKLKTSVSKDRIYQGLRLIERRPDLIAYTPGASSESEPYLKDDGSVFWEFYFNLYKYSLGNDTVVRLERKGKKDKWSARKLVEEIHKERNIISGDYKNERKNEIIKKVHAIMKNIKNIHRLENILKKAEEEIRIENEESK